MNEMKCNSVSRDTESFIRTLFRILRRIFNRHVNFDLRLSGKNLQSKLETFKCNFISEKFSGLSYCLAGGGEGGRGELSFEKGKRAEYEKMVLENDRMQKWEWRREKR